MKRILIVAAVLSLAVIPASVSAWGNTGHRLIGMAAVRGLPEEMPAFLRTPAAATEVGELSREPDRTKGVGSRMTGSATRPISSTCWTMAGSWLRRDRRSTPCRG